MQVAEWGIKRMKTHWNPCSLSQSYLTKSGVDQEAPCLEYIIPHEMVHLLERHHGERSAELMDHAAVATLQGEAGSSSFGP